QGTEAQLIAIRSRGAPAGNSHDDELGIYLVQDVGSDAEALKIARPKVLDQDLSVLHQLQKRCDSVPAFQIEGQAAFIAAHHFPIHGVSVVAYRAKSVANAGLLYFQHVGAKIGKIKCQRSEEHTSELQSRENL